MSVALIWNELMLHLTQHKTSHGAWDNSFEPQSVISGMITEHRPLTNHKPEGLEMKLKCMPIFTHCIIQESKDQLILRCAHTMLTHD